MSSRPRASALGLLPRRWFWSCRRLRHPVAPAGRSRCKLGAKILRKALLRARQMIAHGSARSVWIVCRNGVAHGTMLAKRGPPRARVFEIVRKLREIGIETLVEQFADHAHQHGVAETSGDRDVEGAVVNHRGFAGMLDILHRDEGGIDARDVRFRRGARGLLGDRTLE